MKILNTIIPSTYAKLCRFHILLVLFSFINLSILLICLCPSQHFSVMLEWFFVFQGWTSTKQRSEAYHSTTALLTCADPEGGTGGLDPPPPLKNKTYIGFLSNTIQDPLKNHIASKPSFNVGLSSARQWWPLKRLSKLDPLWQNFQDQRMPHILLKHFKTICYKDCNLSTVLSL